MALVIVLVIAHILFIGGCYLFTLGVNLVVKGSTTAKEIITNPLFWGLFMILGALSLIFHHGYYPYGKHCSDKDFSSLQRSLPCQV